MNISYKVVKKIIGEIEPVGSEHIDKERFKNLEQTILLIEDLISDIEKVSKYNDRIEYSMKKAGEKAYEFRNSLTAKEKNVFCCTECRKNFKSKLKDI